MDPPPARSLLDRLQDGSRSPAWEEFVHLYTPLFRFWLRPHLFQSHDIDDVVQDVLLVVLGKLSEFHPTGPGAFRAWLRAIVGYRLQTFWRQKIRGHAVGAFDAMLAGLEDHNSPLSRSWDEEHDRHVVGTLLGAVQDGFHPTTWEAFRRTALGGEPPAVVAADLGITANAVFIARSRVMRRLRDQAAGLVNEN